MDNSKISVFELNLPAIWFDKWIVPINSVVGILTSLFYNILNLSENSILIEYDPFNETDKLNIELKIDKCVITYELPLINIEVDVLQIPVVEYIVDMKMKSGFFFNIVDKLKKFGGDNFEIECNEDCVRLYANTVETGKMSAEIKIEDLMEYAIGEDKSIGSFGMSFIYNIACFYKVSETINIHFTNGEPLKIVYMLSDCLEDNNEDRNEPRIIFYLAPKFDVNDD
jgi:hypothetical protein